ncbi:MAG TPA: aldolase/citrate lyase family protein [Bacteroidales bacterium]|nr:aldolase/citrate lyase family protein [Bacteroidales bacterium]
MAQSFRKKLIEGETMIGTLLTIPSPAVAEIMVQSGFDWLFIDMEHSTISLQDAEGMIRAAGNKAHCIIRCPSNDEAWIKRCLDTGADGIILPRINTLKEAQYAVYHAKYPPVGNRSVGISRAHGYGSMFNEYLERANEDIALIIQCEHRDALGELDQMVALEGIDAIFVGPYDLSASMNKTGQVEAPEVQKAIDQIQQVTRKAQKPLGIFATTPSGIKKWQHQDFSLLAMGVDSALLASAGKQILKQFKENR